MATWTANNKNSATFTPVNVSMSQSLLLKQDSGYLLLQSGDRIILNGGSSSSTSWTNANKN